MEDRHAHEDVREEADLPGRTRRAAQAPHRQRRARPKALPVQLPLPLRQHHAHLLPAPDAPLRHVPCHLRRRHPTPPPLHGTPRRSTLHPGRRTRRVVGALPARRDDGRTGHRRPRGQERAGLLRPDRTELAPPPRGITRPRAPRRRDPLHPHAGRVHGTLHRPRDGVRRDRTRAQEAQRRLLLHHRQRRQGALLQPEEPPPRLQAAQRRTTTAS